MSLVDNVGNGNKENGLSLVSVSWRAGKCLFFKRYWANCAGNGHIQKLVYLFILACRFAFACVYVFSLGNLNDVQKFHGRE